MSDASNSESARRGACPDEASIAAYVEGERKGEIEAHLAACDECRSLVSALAKSEAHDVTLPAASSELTPGRVIAEKYEIETLLGSGGMGVVARAKHLVLGTSVVVKLLKAPDADDDSVRRFLREARAGAALDSEHVVRVLDAGLFQGRPYLVLEHLRGRDLAQQLEAKGALPVEDAVSYVLQACEALATAHGRGIVHRDIKPANLFLTQSADGEPLLKVLDFGIAKAAEDSGIATLDAGLTHTAAIMGSPRYMSPEQLEHTAGVDARADVWSLGAVLYELCAGKPAFDAPNMAALATAILTKEPPPLSNVPAELAAVVARCLKKDREERMPSVAALARALVPFARAEQITLVDRVERIAASTRSSVMPAPPARGEPLAASVDGITGPPHTKKHTLGWLLAAAGAVALALALWSMREPRRELSSGAMLRGALAARAVQLPARKLVATPSATPPPATAEPPRPRRPPSRPLTAPSASAARPPGINAHGLLDRK